MKIAINRNNTVLNDIKQDLEEQFGATYKIRKRRKNAIALAKGKVTGAVVTLTKNKIIVVGTFPNPWIYGLFVFTMVLTGILIPMVLYHIFYHKKMEQYGKEVATYVAQNYAV